MNSLDGLITPFLIVFGVCSAASLLTDWRTRSMSLSLIPIVLALMISLWLKDVFGLPSQAVTLACVVYIGIRIWLFLSRLMGGRN